MNRRNRFPDLRSQKEIDEEKQKRWKHFFNTVVWQSVFVVIFITGLILWIKSLV